MQSENKNPGNSTALDENEIDENDELHELMTPSTAAMAKSKERSPRLPLPPLRLPSPGSTGSPSSPLTPRLRSIFDDRTRGSRFHPVLSTDGSAVESSSLVGDLPELPQSFGCPPNPPSSPTVLANSRTAPGSPVLVRLRKFLSAGSLARLYPSSLLSALNAQHTAEEQPDDNDTARRSQRRLRVVSPRVRMLSEGQTESENHLHHVGTVPAFERLGYPITDLHERLNNMAEGQQKQRSKVRNYYRKQSELLKKYQEDELAVLEFVGKREKRMSNNSVGSRAANSVLRGNSGFDRQVSTDPSDMLTVSFNFNDELSGPDGDTPQSQALLAEDATRINLERNPHDDGRVEGVRTVIVDSNDDLNPVIPKETTDERDERLKRKERLLAKVSFVVNVFLLIAKLIATILSGSYSIVSSLVDSCVDLTSGGVIWATGRAIRKRDPYMYPRGRTRLEPLALIIISVVMAVASIQIIVQSTEACISGDFLPDVGIDTILLMVATISAKFILFMFCYKYRAIPSVAVLAQDHRNDCISNSVAIICAFAGAHLWRYCDPIGAIIVSVYIVLTWFTTGYEQIKMLSGRTAEPSFINRIVKIVLEHDHRIESIDTVYVYHFGTKFLVEAHVVLPAEMSLREAHDISEPLQNKLEALDYVERAFVHVDYETDHRSEDEHKVV